MATTTFAPRRDDVRRDSADLFHQGPDIYTSQVRFDNGREAFGVWFRARQGQWVATLTETTPSEPHPTSMAAPMPWDHDDLKRPDESGWNRMLSQFAQLPPPSASVSL